MSKSSFIVVLLAALALIGCESEQMQQVRDFRPPPAPDYLALAQQAYDAGQYERALSRARSAHSIVGANNDQAAYIAGMSAYQLQKLEFAQRFLAEAGESRDAQIAGPALAQLGVIYADRGRYDLASGALVRAADHLDGQEKANAYYYAAQAERQLDRWWTTRTYLLLAQRYADDDAFRMSIAQELGATGWTIQVAQFADEDEARAFERQLAARAQPLDIGLPQVVRASDAQGRTVYVVQIGQFAIYDTAARKRQQLGINDAAVVSIQE
jgi:tetratricopeptide (TPR) repeat protein